MIEAFREAFANRYRLAREERERGRPVIGWVCSYVPEEIFYAAGALPLRILGGREETPQADAYLYSNNCSFARSCLEEGLKGNYDFLDGYVSCNTCDHIRRLYDVWVDYVHTPFSCILGLPHKFTPAAVAFFRDELRRLVAGLEEALGRKISEEDLRQAIQCYNRTRELLRQLYELRKADPPPISGSEVLEVILAGMVLPRERYNRMLEELLARLPIDGGLQSAECGAGGSRSAVGHDPAAPAHPTRESSSPPAGRPRLLVVGSVLDNPEYLRIIEGLGSSVVVDDLCNGTRYFWDRVEEEGGDPLERLARRYLGRVPCARMRPAAGRLAHIQQLTRDFRVDGIVYEVIKFCDLYGADFPIFREGLKETGLPILALDREYAMAGAGQMKTRVQAFLERIAD